MNRNFILPLCLASLALTTGKNEAANPAAEPPPAQVPVMIAKPETVTVRTILPGRLEAFRQAEVRARVPGIIKKRCYEEGQAVKEGTVLFEIDPDLLEANKNIALAAVERAAANVKRADANHASAKDRVERYSKLVESGGVSERSHTEAKIEEMTAKAEYDLAIAELASAKAERDKSQIQLDYATVTAPISGQARRAFVTEGALVGQDVPTPLTIVEQIDPIYVKFSQPSAEVANLRRAITEGEWKGIAPKDIKVHLIFSDDYQYPIDGKFIFADMAVNTDTDNIEMRALFPNPKTELLPGAYVRIAFDMALQENVVKVPRDAVLRTEQGAIVWSVSDQNQIIPIPVKAERMEGKNWLVTSGLKGGEKIVVEQVLKMSPGAKVNITSIVDASGKVLENLSGTPAPDQGATPQQNQPQKGDAPSSKKTNQEAK